MKKWISYSGYAPFLSAPSQTAPKINGINLPPKTVIETNGTVSGAYEQAVYRGLTGWVKSEFMETYEQNLPHDLVDMSGLQTENEHDFFQYAVLFGKTQYNLCGEICAAYVAGVDLQTVIDNFKQKEPSYFNRIFNMNTSRVASGTSDGDLVRIFRALGREAKTLSNYKAYTPQKAKELTGAIVSVRIDGATGEIRGSGVLHWVVITEVFCERQGRGLVYFFNPAYGGVEVCSWREFIASARVPYGAIISPIREADS